MRAEQRRFIGRRSIAALILLGMLACAASGCWDGYDYGGGYPAYGYAPYSWGWGGYSPGFAVGHPWEGHWGGEGHHTSFYHAGGGGGFHGGGHGGGGHGGGGHR
jgi:hypothetical protein